MDPSTLYFGQFHFQFSKSGFIWFFLSSEILVLTETVSDLIRWHTLWHLTWVYSDCQHQITFLVMIGISELTMTINYKTKFTIKLFKTTLNPFNWLSATMRRLRLLPHLSITWHNDCGETISAWKKKKRIQAFTIHSWLQIMRNHHNHIISIFLNSSQKP